MTIPKDLLLFRCLYHLYLRTFLHEIVVTKYKLCTLSLLFISRKRHSLYTKYIFQPWCLSFVSVFHFKVSSMETASAVFVPRSKSWWTNSRRRRSGYHYPVSRQHDASYLCSMCKLFHFSCSVVISVRMQLP